VDTEELEALDPLHYSHVTWAEPEVYGRELLFLQCFAHLSAMLTPHFRSAECWFRSKNVDQFSCQFRKFIEIAMENPHGKQ
jgi:hypothetical protein